MGAGPGRHAAASQDRARIHLLGSPHNPTGTVHRRHDLERLAALATRSGVVVLADQIHVPLGLPGRTHHPLVSVSPEAAGHGIVVTSASKAWNLAGLKAAVIITADPATRRLVQRLPEELPWRVGHLGVLGSIAKGRVALSSGPSFGRPGIGHARLNLGTSRQLLAEAVDRMASAIGR